MKEIRFDKAINGVCCYITIDRWYKVEQEGNLNYKIIDDSGILASYPKAWVEETRNIE